MKYIVVTGGVISGLGKGITTSSIGRLLKSAGLRVVPIKIDPYLNCDAGTMNPFQHGEVYVLDDGGEVDLDLGNYERFMDLDLSKNNNITTGKVYLRVIERERKGEYLGETVQIIPHITSEIKRMIRNTGVAENADVVLIEVGGTVGDIESMPFLEALRELKMEVGDDNILFIHTTLIPIIGSVGEQKTKPTQHSVKELRSIGIQPSIIVARGVPELEEKTKQKLTSFCEVSEENIISAPDMDIIYEVPLYFEQQNLYENISTRLKIDKSKVLDMKEWSSFVGKLKSRKGDVSIAMMGKYTALKDSYLSYIEAINHASAEVGVKVHLDMLPSEDFEVEGNTDKLSKYDGIIVPGGFGNRGVEGKIKTIEYARKNKKPFLGICLGFQLTVIEFARNIVGWKDATSTEFTYDTAHPVITLLPEQENIVNKGATMRLGAQWIKLKPNTRAFGIYKAEQISERHRHRYEVNPKFIPELEAKGLAFSSTDLKNERMETLEIYDQPFYFATQFHPEFKSRPSRPSPVYLAFLKSVVDNMRK